MVTGTQNALGIGSVPVNPGRRNANHGIGSSIEDDPLAYQRRIRRKSPPPQVVAHHDNRIRAGPAQSESTKPLPCAGCSIKTLK